jgi:hypothetical protein
MNYFLKQIGLLQNFTEIFNLGKTVSKNNSILKQMEKKAIETMQMVKG